MAHGCGIFQHLCNLYASRDELQYSSIVLEWVILKRRWLEGTFQDGHEMLDLVIIEDSGGYPPLSGKAFQQIDPFRPFSVL